MGPAAEKLSCISIVICDEIHRDERTKKLILVGTFNRIGTAALPCRHPRMNVLFSLTNGRGRYDLEVVVEHEESGKGIAEIRGPFQSDSPIKIHDVCLALQNMTFLEAGKYWVTVKANGELLQQRPFLVETAQEEKSRD